MSHFVLQIIDPYVEIEIIGIPADNAKHRTKTIEDNGMHSGQVCFCFVLFLFKDISE
jgi:hypothetical protein